jgi:type IV pilus assembly protein PilC
MSAIADNMGGAAANQPAEEEQICFNYSGTDSMERPVSYYLFADNEDHALKVLEHAGISNVSVWPRKETFRLKRKRVSRKDRGLIALQLAERVKANQKMSYAVGQMAKVNNHPVLRTALYDVRNALKHDVDKPADAFRKRVDVFGQSFCKIIEVATSENNTGDPSEILTEYGESQIKTAENISRMIGATIYPSVVLGVATGILFVLCYWVMPQMEEMYKGLLETTQAELPLPTTILLAVSHFMIGPGGIVVMLLIFGGIFFGYKKLKSDEGSEWIQRKCLSWPLVGPLVRLLNAAYTIHLIAILSDVITPKETLKEVASASLNVVYEENLLAMRKSLVEDSLKFQTVVAPYAFLFGDDFQAQITTAEDAGDLSQLNRYAKMLDKQVEESISRLSKLIEPLTILVAGGVIFLIILSFYLPMFTLIGRLANKH